MVLDQARRGIVIQMIDGFGIDHADLLALDEGRHRHHDGEFLGVALEIAGHGDRGLIAIARQHDLWRRY